VKSDRSDLKNTMRHNWLIDNWWIGTQFHASSYNSVSMATSSKCLARDGWHVFTQESDPPTWSKSNWSHF
jgi:hypothetical protein